MKKILFFVATVTLFSCMTENNSDFDRQKDKNIQKNDEIWICHNPESTIHQQICPEGEEYLCLEPGDSSKFCWKLKFEDCEAQESEVKQKICENFH